MQSLEEFKTEVCKKRGDKQFKVRNSFGIYDCYKLIRKNKWYDIGKPVSEHDFYAIVRGINNILADNLANGDTVYFPHRMGKLELRKGKRGVKLIDQKLKVTYPINWDETLKLWYEDEEAKKKKILLRNEQEYVYRVKYCKQDATYENKIFYDFTLNRFIKQALRDNIEQRKIDALW